MCLSIWGDIYDCFDVFACVFAVVIVYVLRYMSVCVCCCCLSAILTNYRNDP